MIGYASDDVAKPSLGVDVVQASGLDERVYDSGAAAAFIRAGEQIVFSSEGQRPHCALGGVVSHFEAPVIDVARQRRPARCGVAEGAGETALAADLFHRRVEEGAQLGEDRRRLCATRGEALGRRPCP